MDIYSKGDFAHDSLDVQRTGDSFAETLDTFTVVMTSGRATIQTYLSARQLYEHMAACKALLAAAT